jgi:hypothetical protein
VLLVPRPPEHYEERLAGMLGQASLKHSATCTWNGKCALVSHFVLEWQPTQYLLCGSLCSANDAD